MDTEIDHYAVLGLSSGVDGEEGGAKLTEKEITKAYRSKALELHPDKRPNDPDAHVNFQKLRTSYEILKDEKARKLFDDLVRAKHDKLRRQKHHQDEKARRKLRRQTYQDEKARKLFDDLVWAKHDKLWDQIHQYSKRRKMMSDLKERERGCGAYDSNDPISRAKAEEERRITKKLQEEINRIRSQFTNNKMSDHVPPAASNTNGGGAQSSNNFDKEKVVKVSWEKTGAVDYGFEKLKNIFGKFGIVEDVLIKSSTTKKKKGSALLVMASTRDAAAVVAATTWNVFGDISNPLLVLPPPLLQPTISTDDSTSVSECE